MSKKKKPIIRFQDKNGNVVEQIVPLTWEEYEKLSDEEKEKLLKALAQHTEFIEVKEINQ